MLKKDDDKSTDTLRAREKRDETSPQDPLADLRGLLSPQAPAGANEAASAALAERELALLGVGTGCAGATSAAIAATADHRLPPDRSPTTAVVLDADLAILAAEPARYEAYVTGVRAEYAHVDDEGWRAGRAAVLTAFLDRPVIFVTAPMHASEHRARANLAAELSRLRASV